MAATAAPTGDSVAALRAANAEMLATQTAINIEQMKANTQKAVLDANRGLWDKIR